MEDFFNTFIGRIIRWLCFLPAAVLALLVVHGGVMLIMLLTGSYWYESLLEILMRSIFAAGVSGYCYILVGAAVAPDFKKFISIILSILIILVSLFGLFSYGWVGYTDYMVFGKLESWQDILSLISSIVGVVIGTMKVFEDEYSLF